MHTAAFQAENGSKTNAGPLRVLHSAVGASVVARQCLDNCLVGGAHLTHGECIEWKRVVKNQKEGNQQRLFHSRVQRKHSSVVVCCLCWVSLFFPLADSNTKITAEYDAQCRGNSFQSLVVPRSLFVLCVVRVVLALFLVFSVLVLLPVFSGHNSSLGFCAQASGSVLVSSVNRKFCHGGRTRFGTLHDNSTRRRSLPNFSSSSSSIIVVVVVVVVFHRQTNNQTDQTDQDRESKPKLKTPQRNEKHLD